MIVIVVVYVIVHGVVLLCCVSFFCFARCGCSVVGGLHWFVLDFAGLCVALPLGGSRSFKTRSDVRIMKSIFDEITATTTTRNPFICAYS